MGNLVLFQWLKCVFVLPSDKCRYNQHSNAFLMESFTFQSHWSQKIYISWQNIWKEGKLQYCIYTKCTIEYENFKKDTALFINRMEIDK